MEYKNFLSETKHQQKSCQWKLLGQLFCFIVSFEWKFRYGIPGRRNANQKLRTCCRGLKDADIECRRRFCDFNALRPDMVIGFMAQCAPKGPTVGEMWDCASSRADHTQCCRQQGIHV
ncbi:unnamed protein product [Nippostrongylus brasiliensis]|uniref:DB domain-containing protein n=1 Tax=Nippostrongylus brasiliensis TaxID=27835 RepID=A0A0N4XHP4_NIPBR|nr:unnamed protein product [Nippostrongylus brasiliensis]